MSKIKNFSLAFLMLASIFLTTGCNFDYKQLFREQKKPEQKLIKAEIHFGENDKVVGYIKSLGVEEDSKVYIGGSSLNYLYDQQGNVIGSYNYSRVEYINILPEEQR